MSSHPKRIAIVGMPGAGKSYYAEILSKKLGIENIKLDSIFDEKPSRFFDIRSYRKEFNRLLKNRESWIVGAYHGYRMPEWFWESADLIIFIDLPKSELRKNVIGRYKSKKAAGDNTHF
ncbi:hypothetical protein KC992_01850, partial [Candidatus Saccharibacteria bacterium]|nr:hypothetical protein [Candidatus Saccharibacteria bacterium]